MDDDIEYDESLLEGCAIRYWESYPRCCNEGEGYNPLMNLTVKEESYCEIHTEACSKEGEMWLYKHETLNPTGKQPLEDVKQAIFIARYYDNDDPNGLKFEEKYLGKTLHMRTGKGTLQTTAKIVDTCRNSECGDCCKTWSHNNCLIEIEYWTVDKMDPGSVEMKSPWEVEHWVDLWTECGDECRGDVKWNEGGRHGGQGIS